MISIIIWRVNWLGWRFILACTGFLLVRRWVMRNLRGILAPFFCTVTRHRYMRDPCDHYTIDLIGGTRAKPGRKPLGERAMTPAERKRRSRELRRNRLQELSVTVELSRDAQKALDKMIEWWGVSKKEAINRAMLIACQSQTGRTGTLFEFDAEFLLPQPVKKRSRKKAE